MSCANAASTHAKPQAKQKTTIRMSAPPPLFSTNITGQCPKLELRRGGTRIMASKRGYSLSSSSSFRTFSR